ncbi:hypothetical protein QL285_094671 [Trifolium repens]|nr:hypothetical protein QL285_094671 [Trifolium repens]
MGRSLLVRDRELESSGILLGRVGVFSGGLEAVECLSKNEIRSGPLLDGVSFGFVHRCSAYIRSTFCYVVPLLPVSVRLVQRLGFNNIFAVKKK